ncbi:hypothetical protein ABPG77_004451 [Micractinium sp. CCAP 211/92]
MDSHFYSVPDDLLDFILSFVHYEWNRLRRVCKRWRAAVDGSPVMSRWVNTCEHGKEAIQHLDGAALVRLAAAKAGVAVEGYLCQAHLPGVLEAAQQLTGLTSLNITSSAYEKDLWDQPDFDCGAAVAARPFSLASMAHSLANLDLAIDCLRPVTCPPLGELSALTFLAVGTFVAAIPAELWAAVAHLPRLADLNVSVHTLEERGPCHIGSTAWTDLAACTQLSRLKLEHQTVKAYNGCSPGKSQPSQAAAAWIRFRQVAAMLG